MCSHRSGLFRGAVDQPLITGKQILNTVIVSDTEGITDTGYVDTPVTSLHELEITKDGFFSSRGSRRAFDLLHLSGG